MKYTKEDIKEGFVFTTSINHPTRYICSNFKVKHCDLTWINNLGDKESSKDYPIDVILRQLNDGSWFKVERRVYEIY